MKWKVVSPYTGIEEDAPASSAGGGNIAGIGVDHPDRPGSGEPGVDPKKKKKKHTLIDRNGKIDGRSKSYKQHRAKLEAARKKRLERKNSAGSKFIENIKKKASEMTYGEAYDMKAQDWVTPAHGSAGSQAADVKKAYANVTKGVKKKYPSKKSEMAYSQGFDTMKPMADMSNKDLQASKKKKK